ncbi:MAG TPA: CoA-binding protein [Peptococcaceae bacterium]|nr:CoA-binding protein [Peptococcaceae bacterium]
MSERIMLEKMIWAVVGVSPNPQKYGYKVYQKLKKCGYKVYAVNPFYENIEEDKCYKDLSSLPEIPQVVNMVISAKKGKAVIEEAAKLGIKYVWFQPGSCDKELLELTGKLGMESVQACVLVSTK